jgi:hypothetical protein
MPDETPAPAPAARAPKQPHDVYPSAPLEPGDVPVDLLEAFRREAPTGDAFLYAGVRRARMTAEERAELKALCKLAKTAELDAPGYARHRALVERAGGQTIVVRLHRQGDGEPQIRRLLHHPVDAVTPPEAHAFSWGPEERSNALADAILRDALKKHGKPESASSLLKELLNQHGELWVLHRREVLCLVSREEIGEVVRRAVARGMTAGEILRTVYRAGSGKEPPADVELYASAEIMALGTR